MRIVPSPTAGGSLGSKSQPCEVRRTSVPPTCSTRRLCALAMCGEAALRCIWNEKGKCRNGDQCRFAHGLGELRLNQKPENTQDRGLF